jgi:hypothetical protein
MEHGPVEGQINRLKTLKRQMDGLAGVSLLRARVLPAAAAACGQLALPAISPLGVVFPEDKEIACLSAETRENRIEQH